MELRELVGYLFSISILTAVSNYRSSQVGGDDLKLQPPHCKDILVTSVKRDGA